jgi:hypothetical protein
VKNLVGKTVKLPLVGLDGNAFALLGAFRQAASEQDWTEAEIQAVLNEARSGDSEHLLAVLLKHAEERE